MRVGMITAALLLMCSCAQAFVPSERAVNAILGEAEGEGYAGMYAVACAIRNRGTLKGVYGERAPRVVGGKIERSVRVMAERAWAESERGRDVTGGATHWENVRAFGWPDWAKGARVTLRLGQHVFFKGVR